MKRRDFLKKAAIVITGATVVPIVVKANPEYSYSASASISDLSSVDPLVDPNGMWAKDMAKHCQEGMDEIIIDIAKKKNLF